MSWFEKNTIVSTKSFKMWIFINILNTSQTSATILCIYIFTYNVICFEGQMADFKLSDRWFSFLLFPLLYIEYTTCDYTQIELGFTSNTLFAGLPYRQIRWIQTQNKLNKRIYVNPNAQQYYKAQKWLNADHESVVRFIIKLGNKNKICFSMNYITPYWILESIYRFWSRLSHQFVMQVLPNWP